MDASKGMSADCRQNNALEGLLQRVIDEQDLSSQRESILHVTTRLDISLLDCAAALLYLNHPPQLPRTMESRAEMPVKPAHRSVRYRLDIGGQHRVSKEQIQAVLIDESGVDKKRIGRIDIRHNYTLVELPDGMPADIFQLLSEATINGRRLAIKRVKPNRRRQRDAGEKG